MSILSVTVIVLTTELVLYIAVFNINFKSLFKKLVIVVEEESIENKLELGITDVLDINKSIEEFTEDTSKQYCPFDKVIGKSSIKSVLKLPSTEVFILLLSIIDCPITSCGLLSIYLVINTLMIGLAEVTLLI